MSNKVSTIITLIWKILGVVIPWLKARDKDEEDSKESSNPDLFI